MAQEIRARLPLVTDGRHAVAEETSLALHRAVAERLRADPSQVERARRRVEAWLGFTPMALPKGAIGYHWTERAGVRTPLRVAKMSDMPTPPAGSRVAAVDLKFEKGTLVVSYTLPRL